MCCRCLAASSARTSRSIVYAISSKVRAFACECMAAPLLQRHKAVGDVASLSCQRPQRVLDMPPNIGEGRASGGLWGSGRSGKLTHHLALPLVPVTQRSAGWPKPLDVPASAGGTRPNFVVSL